MSVWKKIGIILGIIVLLIAGVIFFLWLGYHTGFLQKKVVDEVARNVASADDRQTALIERAMGFSGDRHYLILFENNTELRPGGGFIGAYGVLTLSKGVPKIELVQGIEILDLMSSSTGDVPPPALAQYLEIKKWQLRDSNWSPDFPTDAVHALKLYSDEKGLDNDQLDGVIAFTPTVVEELLKITGSFSVDGQTFTADNFTNNLEYQVEYGYQQQGIAFHDRKQFLADAVQALAKQLMLTGYKHYNEYVGLLPKLVQEKQVMFYSVHDDEQAELANVGWTGAIAPPADDYLLWVDANLGSLKTDTAVTRTIHYSIATSTTGLVATASATIVNNGSFTWRTTRYRDYARVFVPLGSTFVSSTGTMLEDKSTKPGPVDQGVELNHQWFGGFVSIEPHQTRTISFTYRLPTSTVAAVKQGSYALTVGKELGVIDPGITLHLQFGTPLTSAHPSEARENVGDTAYDYTGVLSSDQVFAIHF